MDEKLRDVIKPYANLRGMDLRNADLSYADLRGINLHEANLRNANLSGANFQMIKVLNTDFRGANIDNSCWPLSRFSLDVKIDERIACQLLYHVINAMQSVDSEKAQEICNDEKSTCACESIPYGREVRNTRKA